MTDCETYKDVGDFKSHFSVIVIAPDESVSFDEYLKRSQSPLSWETKVRQFEANYCTWNLWYACLLAYGGCGDIKYSSPAATSDSEAESAIRKAMIDGGFAILALLNPYIEVVGRLCGDFPNFPFQKDKPKKCIPTGDFVKEGLCCILPELRDSKLNKSVDLFQNAVRNSMAHNFFTGENVILSESHSEVLLVGTIQDKAAISVNPRALLQCVMKHFEQYVRILGSNDDISDEARILRERFDQRYPAGLRLCKDKKNKHEKKQA